VNFKRINKALQKRLGYGVVRIMHHPHGEEGYILRFRANNPSQRVIQTAVKVVADYETVIWDYAAAKRVDKF